MINIEQQWEDICKQMESLYDDNILREYVKQIKPSIDGNDVVLNVPNRFMHDWLRRKQYDSVIFEKFQKIEPHLQHVDVRLQNYFESQSQTVSLKDDDVLAHNFVQPQSENSYEIRLNPLMTFESYVVGSSNELAAIYNNVRARVEGFACFELWQDTGQ